MKKIYMCVVEQCYKSNITLAIGLLVFSYFEHQHFSMILNVINEYIYY